MRASEHGLCERGGRLGSCPVERGGCAAGGVMFRWGGVAVDVSWLARGGGALY